MLNQIYRNFRKIEYNICNCNELGAGVSAEALSKADRDRFAPDCPHHLLQSCSGRALLPAPPAPPSFRWHYSEI